MKVQYDWNSKSRAVSSDPMRQACIRAYRRIHRRIYWEARFLLKAWVGEG